MVLCCFFLWYGKIQKLDDYNINHRKFLQKLTKEFSQKRIKIKEFCAFETKDNEKEPKANTFLSCL